ncbi:MAG: ATP synthase F1 subunit epsilon [Candidatus Omnitrophica bacterium]|nr:ATP synthase F1 subunit epsilon [Candidatus Omnitrophota bacterium]
MTATYKLSLITPEGAIFEEHISAVSVPGEEGSFGVLRRHAPIVAKLKAGVIRVRQDGQELFFAAGPGLLEVNHHSECLLLVDYARPAANKEEAQKFLHQTT